MKWSKEDYICLQNGRNVCKYVVSRKWKYPIKVQILTGFKVQSMYNYK